MDLKLTKERHDLFDLTDDTAYRTVREMADDILEGADPSGESLFAGLAGILADSKRSFQAHRTKPLRVAILMNLIHEQNRLRPSSPDNPNGENSLENKLKQLDWLLAGSAVDYRLIYVSGTCPWGSDAVLERQVARIGTDKVVHLRIEDSPHENQFIRNQKGGELIFGMRSILNQPGYPDPGEFDCMLFTDADMTLDMGQLGTLIDGYHTGKDLICGNRMDPDSILVKNMTRAGSGVLLFRHFQRKLAPLFFRDMNLLDTQCPWKFLSRSGLKKIVPDLDCMDWSIDTDILSSAYSHGITIHTQAISAIDSELESHGKALGHYVRNKTIIDGTIHQAQKYDLPYDREIARLVARYLRTDDDYRALLESGLPESLEHLPNEEWGRSEEISPDLLEEWLRAITT